MDLDPGSSIGISVSNHATKASQEFTTAGTTSGFEDSICADTCGYGCPQQSQHLLQRHQYCRWLKGDLQRDIPVYVKPDHRLSLKELGKKYHTTLGGIKCVLIDLSGTLHIGDKITENAVTALEK